MNVEQCVTRPLDEQFREQFGAGGVVFIGGRNLSIEVMDTMNGMVWVGANVAQRSAFWCGANHCGDKLPCDDWLKRTLSKC